eukprot:TRINITY_DN6186_c0_g1_i2.p1 TRINITY_DN6186_c0_g1~~TRINITY_DN6186_c0_g1_i2.p1  ORF type:complete len:1031 (+),score=210.24 TRINITY_DN6186_c0_g1_i2:121-3093(+)
MASRTRDGADVEEGVRERMRRDNQDQNEPRSPVADNRTGRPHNLAYKVLAMVSVLVLLGVLSPEVLEIDTGRYDDHQSAVAAASGKEAFGIAAEAVKQAQREMKDQIKEAAENTEHIEVRSMGSISASGIAKEEKPTRLPATKAPARSVGRVRPEAAAAQIPAGKDSAARGSKAGDSGKGPSDFVPAGGGAERTGVIHVDRTAGAQKNEHSDAAASSAGASRTGADEFPAAPQLPRGEKLIPKQKVDQAADFGEVRLEKKSGSGESSERKTSGVNDKVSASGEKGSVSGISANDPALKVPKSSVGAVHKESSVDASGRPKESPRPIGEKNRTGAIRAENPITDGAAPRLTANFDGVEEIPSLKQGNQSAKKVTGPAAVQAPSALFTGAEEIPPISKNKATAVNDSLVSEAAAAATLFAGAEEIPTIAKSKKSSGPVASGAGSAGTATIGESAGGEAKVDVAGISEARDTGMIKANEKDSTAGKEATKKSSAPKGTAGTVAKRPEGASADAGGSRASKIVGLVEREKDVSGTGESATSPFVAKSPKSAGEGNATATNGASDGSLGGLKPEPQVAAEGKGAGAKESIGAIKAENVESTNGKAAEPAAGGANVVLLTGTEEIPSQPKSSSSATKENSDPKKTAAEKIAGETAVSAVAEEIPTISKPTATKESFAAKDTASVGDGSDSASSGSVVQTASAIGTAGKNSDGASAGKEVVGVVKAEEKGRAAGGGVESVGEAEVVVSAGGEKVATTAKRTTPATKESPPAKETARTNNDVDGGGRSGAKEVVGAIKVEGRSSGAGEMSASANGEAKPAMFAGAEEVPTLAKSATPTAKESSDAKETASGGDDISGVSSGGVVQSADVVGTAGKASQNVLAGAGREEGGGAVAGGRESVGLVKAEAGGSIKREMVESAMEATMSAGIKEIPVLTKSPASVAKESLAPKLGSSSRDGGERVGAVKEESVGAVRAEGAAAGSAAASAAAQDILVEQLAT